jgi:hypothetical protein
VSFSSSSCSFSCSSSSSASSSSTSTRGCNVGSTAVSWYRWVSRCRCLEIGHTVGSIVGVQGDIHTRMVLSAARVLHLDAMVTRFKTNKQQ